MTNRIERPQAAMDRLGVKPSLFYERFVYRDADDPNIPGTDLPRLKSVPLSAKAVGFFSDEIDAVIDGLRELRDSGTLPPRVTVYELTERKRERERDAKRRGRSRP